MKTYTVTQTGDSTLSATVTDNTKSISVQGDSNVGVTVTQADDVITLNITPAAVNINSAVLSVNTATGNVVIGTDDISEGSSNLYYTNARADARIQNNLLDEDDFASDSATNTASQQSIKAYVASQIQTKDNTDEITEGSTNLYFTNARADARAQLKIDALVDSAPGALDTLNELAAAMGDDANFSTTVTNSIATKLASADFNSTFDTRLGTKTTDNLTEGSSNLYYTNARADARIANNIIDEDNFSTDSATRAPSQQSVKAYIATQIATKDNSDEITEGSSNLYFTNARAQSAIGSSHIEGLNYDADGGTY